MTLLPASHSVAFGCLDCEVVAIAKIINGGSRGARTPDLGNVNAAL